MCIMTCRLWGVSCCPCQVPRELRDQLASELKASNIPVPESEERWELALQALKGVWASKYNDRCVYNT